MRTGTYTAIYSAWQAFVRKRFCPPLPIAQIACGDASLSTDESAVTDRGADSQNSLLAAAVVIELAAALVAREASPAQVHAMLAPLRAMASLAVMAVVLERIAGALALAVKAAP